MIRDHDRHPRTDWVHQSIHEAVETHRTIRRRRNASKALDATYGPTRYFAASEPQRPPAPIQPPPLVRSDEFGQFKRALRMLRKDRLQSRFARLLAVQEGRCYLCGRTFTLELPATEEHVWPKARKGTDWGNVLLACSPCNNAKGQRLPTEDEMARLREVNAAMDDMRRPGSFLGIAWRGQADV